MTIFKAQGDAIEKYASSNVKVLDVANPANTLLPYCHGERAQYPTQNVSALTRLDHERLRSFLVEKVNENEQGYKITSKDGQQRHYLEQSLEHASAGRYPR